MTEAKGFRIQLTPEWWDLPLDPMTRGSEIDALVAERRADTTPELRRMIAQVLAEAAKVAHDIGAELCAEYGEADAEGNFLSANLMVIEVPLSIEPDEMPTRAAAMANAVKADVGSANPGDLPPAECSVVQLPQVGAAIRMRTDPLPENPDARNALRSLRLQFFVPAPGTGTTAVLTFSSPVVTGNEPHEQLVELFDTLAETFCFLDEDGAPLLPAVT